MGSGLGSAATGVFVVTVEMEAVKAFVHNVNELAKNK